MKRKIHNFNDAAVFEGLFAAKKLSTKFLIILQNNLSSTELARTLSGGIYDLCFLLEGAILRELELVNLHSCCLLMLALMHVFGKLFQRAYEMKTLAGKLI